MAVLQVVGGAAVRELQWRWLVESGGGFGSSGKSNNGGSGYLWRKWFIIYAFRCNVQYMIALLPSVR